MTQTNQISRIITICFIDIAKFSLASQLIRPQEAFTYLHHIMSIITKKVAKYNGTVDNVLGDGALVFFGSDYSGKVVSKTHCFDAIKACVEIQQELLNYNADNVAKGRPVFPIKIGINTSYTYLGRMEVNNRSFKLIVGEGVDFAKRLEEVCEVNSIMLSPITIDILTEDQKKHFDVKKTYISVKHSSKLLEAFSIEPNAYDQEDKLGLVNKKFRSFLKLERDTARVILEKDLPIIVFANKGRIIDFSKTGLKVELPTKFSKNVELEIFIGDLNSEVNNILIELNLLPLKYKVMWSSTGSNGKYYHGLYCREISNFHASILCNILNFFNSEKSLNEIIKIAG